MGAHPKWRAVAQFLTDKRNYAVTWQSLPQTIATDDNCPSDSLPHQKNDLPGMKISKRNCPGDNCPVGFVEKQIVECVSALCSGYYMRWLRLDESNIAQIYHHLCFLLLIFQLYITCIVYYSILSLLLEEGPTGLYMSFKNDRRLSLAKSFYGK